MITSPPAKSVRCLDNRPSLDDYFAFAQLLLLRGVRKLRNTSTNSAELFPSGLAISDYQVDQALSQLLLVDEDQYCAEQLELNQKIHETSERIKTDPSEAHSGCESCQLNNLISTFEFSEIQRLIVILAIAAELDERYGLVMAYLQDDAHRRLPSMSLVFYLLLIDQSQEWSQTSSDEILKPIIETGIVSVTNNTDRNKSFVEHALKIDEGVLGYVTGRQGLGTLLQKVATLQSGLDQSKSFACNRETKRQLSCVERIIINQIDSVARCIFQIVGPSGAGKKVAIRQVAANLGRSLLIVDMAKLIANADWSRMISTIQRDAILNNYVVYWDHLETLLSSENNNPEFNEKVTEAIVDPKFQSFIGSTQRWDSENINIASNVVTVEIPEPGYPERMELWERALSASALEQDIDGISNLAASFRLNGGQIERAAKDAVSRRILAPSPEITAKDLIDAARRSSRNGLANLSTLVLGNPEWDDLVLPLEQKNNLRDICNRFRNQHHVYDSWNFASLAGSRTGINILFAGPSGTGKTMSASIIATELGLEMYRIYLSSVVSKFIGETEKNLEKIFQESEGSNSILLFDEADSIFGKRSEVKDAHDRYANLEVSYLLQKMEDYDGIAILTTNFKKNMDEAFLRRMQFSIEFPLPDEVSRLSIWKNHIPDEAPIDTDVDLQFLASQFNLSGGNIRNIVTSAAFFAVAESKSIGMRHFIKAMKSEYQKLGRLIKADDFGQYHADL